MPDFKKIISFKNFFWSLLLALIFIAYQPGLSGGFVFDDYPNIVENNNLLLNSWSFDEIKRISLSGTAGPLKRPLPVLSFAAQVSVHGLDPWFFKIINILIHLLATFFFGCFVANLIYFLERSKGKDNLDALKASQLIGLFSAFIWGLHPLNLTSVLYVVQRMTSMSALFGIIALFLYCFLRNEFIFRRKGYFFSLLIFGFLSFFIFLSILSKENGLLFIPLIVLVEIFIFRFKGFQFLERKYKILLWFFIFGCLFFIILLIKHGLDDNIYSYRDFSKQERLLTQLRIILLYIYSFFVPDISKMSLYHDDILISHSFIDPIETIYSFIFLLSITFILAFIRNKVFIFSWLWFLISHSMESTFIMLELMHEHRNYFAIMGLCLAIAYFLFLIFENKRKILLLFTSAIGLILFCATFARASEWGNSLLYAKMEADRKPISMRANHSLGREYLIIFEKTGRDNIEVLEEAKKYFDISTKASVKSASGYFGLLFTEMYKKNPDEKIIKDYVDRIEKYYSFSKSEASILANFNSLINCQIQEKCIISDDMVLRILFSPMDNNNFSRSIKSEIMKQVANYAVVRANDWEYAKKIMESSVDYQNSATGQIMYSQVLHHLGHKEEARIALEMAEKLDANKQISEIIKKEKSKQGY